MGDASAACASENGVQLLLGGMLVFGLITFAAHLLLYPGREASNGTRHSGSQVYAIALHELIREPLSR